MNLEVLEQDAAVAVHDRLGQAGGARAVQDVERMVERHRVEGELARLGEQLGPARRVGEARRSVQVGDRYDGGQARQRGPDGGQLIGPVDGPFAMPIAVDADQHLGLDLLQAVDDAARAELRSA